MNVGQPELVSEIRREDEGEREVSVAAAELERVDEPQFAGRISQLRHLALHALHARARRRRGGSRADRRVQRGRLLAWDGAVRRGWDARCGKRCAGRRLAGCGWGEVDVV